MFSDIIFVIGISGVFVFLSATGMTLAVLWWTSNQRRLFDEKLAQMKSQWESEISTMRQEYDFRFKTLMEENRHLREVNATLQIKYETLSESFVNSRQPSIVVSAGRDVDVGEMAGRDKQENA